MMCHASISSSSASKSNNNNTCNNKYICGSAHSIGSDADCNCSWPSAASTTISAHGAASSALAAKQRSSSSYKKYRRAKALNNVQSSSDSSFSYNSNKHDAQRLEDHCSSSCSSNSITSLTPASAPITATASNSCSPTLHRRRRRRHDAAFIAYCSSAASSSCVAAALGAGWNICRAFSLSICMLLLLRAAPSVRGIAVGVDTANANITDLGSPGGYSMTIYSI
ncbi:PREDICTED: putative uncharacterized protein YIL169C [Bactrocera latifrons]|uniref:Uncharacterized protein n=1 Tax=Bactrocera latifrons TaxID=174628 RepID=A0A0K8VVA7_BACLA|nr:PREDICTED: putative uncharacterized protein YIL169C [Bactrocera latifrons]XP_018790845.1 PREDICTED: putative uncharacterized protein YIL169C [Bactrocera latifrons]